MNTWYLKYGFVVVFFSPRSACIITKVMDLMELVSIKKYAPNCMFVSTFCGDSADSAAAASDPMTYGSQNVMRNWRDRE